MKSWSESSNAEGIDMLSDGNCDLTNELGLTMDGSSFGLGNRCKRFAMIIDNGVVQSIDIEEPGAMDVSSAESQLARSSKKYLFLGLGTMGYPMAGHLSKEMTLIFLFITEQGKSLIAG